MNRLQKKCFVISVGMHGLLLVILLVSAAFRNRSEETDAPILSLIPANIIDGASSGGGQPASLVRATPQPPAPQAQVRPAPPERRTETPVTEPQPVRRAERQKQQEPEVETHTIVAVDTSASRPAKAQHHEIHPTFTPAGKSSKHAKSTVSESSTQDSARSEARRLNQIENSLDHLASGVQTSGAARTVVDVEGIGGGGEVFAGYNDVVVRYYTLAWIQPPNAPDRSTWPLAQIVVARDGSIVSADLVGPCGDTTLDKSVIRALNSVTKLPAFPASARDERRTFQIHFVLDIHKEATG